VIPLLSPFAIKEKKKLTLSCPTDKLYVADVLQDNRAKRCNRKKKYAKIRGTVL